MGRTNYEPGRDKNCLRGFQESEVQIEISLVARRDMILSNKQITKALIRLVCAFVVHKPPETGFSHRGPYRSILNKRSDDVKRKTLVDFIYYEGSQFPKDLVFPTLSNLIIFVAILQFL